MKRLLFLLVTGLLLLFYSCQKRTADPNLPGDVGLAKKYFEATIEPGAGVPDAENPRSKFAKTPTWESPTEVLINGGKRLITPVTFASRSFIYSKMNPGYWYDLSKITFLVMDKVGDGIFNYSVLTIVPDNALDSINRSGYMLMEDWAGHSQQSPKRFDLAKSINGSSKESDVLESIQVCNDIHGYNYSVDDPGDGESWVETTCTIYSFNNPTASGSIRPGGLPRGIPALSYITVAPQADLP